MSEFVAKTRKVGNDIIIVLPKQLLQTEQIGAETLVKVTIQKCQKPGSGAIEKKCTLGPEDPWKLLE